MTIDPDRGRFVVCAGKYEVIATGSEPSFFIFSCMIESRMHKMISLNNGLHMPRLGLGVYKTPSQQTQQVVSLALDTGYRLIDTAVFYKNEVGVGNAIRHSGIPREDIFVTTKLFPTRFFGVEEAFERSLDRLGLEYIDLYLIHFPFFCKKFVWKVLEKITASGRVKSIGVSNFSIKDLEQISKDVVITPAVNQVEFHPFLYRKELLDYCSQKGIVLEAHSPLTHGYRLQDTRISAVAQHYQKTNGQLLIRWSLQHGLVVIPKTTRLERLKENINVFDFEITHEDMMVLDALNENDQILKRSFFGRI